MSDALSALSGITSGVPVLGSLGSLVASQLSIASWRGVPFYMLSDDSEAGQRVIKFLFPGRAAADFRWLGPEDGDMHVDGLLIGSDCVRQAARMRAVCQQDGKGTLVHPWWGSFDAVLTEKARFGVSERELGLVHFSAVFQRYQPPIAASPDWFGRLQDQVDGLMAQATSLLGDVFSALDGPLAAYSFATGLLQTASTLWDGLGIGAGGSAAQTAVAPAAAALADTAPVLDSTFPGVVAALLAAPALALATASQVQAVAAVGPGPLADASTAAVDPADAAAALLSVTTGLAAPATAATAGQLIALAAQMQTVAQAAAVGATIPFTSVPDAQAWQEQIDGALGTIQAQASTLARAAPLSAGAAWRTIADTRSAANADILARLVNLPELLSITTDRTLDAWRIALALCGDTPSLMTSAVVDLWRRNAIGNPAIVPAGTYAVLP